jgi:sarcosine oxidase
MTQPYDAIVLGVGAMGSAACWHLARRGQRVLGLERFDIPHRMGSSHGLTRIIRLAYYESPQYVPMLRRAYENWREAERLFGEQLLFITGSLDAGPSDSLVFQGSLDCCRQHELTHEVLDARQIGARFPGYALPSTHRAVYQPDGGFIASERGIVAHVMLAQAEGADIHARERVLGWEPAQDAVRVRTQRGIYEAGKLIVSAGAWIGQFVPQLAPLARPERQVLGWFQPKETAIFRPDRFPVCNLLAEEGRLYALPVWGMPGLKIGRFHHRDEIVDPDSDFRDCTAEDEAVLRAPVRRYFPLANGPTMGLAACIFTNTPDEHFVLDTLAGCEQVVVASPCSGHGYKFSSVIGEILADLAMTGETRFDLSPFRLSRLMQ